jgi:hypothetical protein
LHRTTVFAFRGSIADQPEHAFVLSVLDPGKRYRLRFEDGSAPDRNALGSELMGKGLAVRLPETLTSELVFFEASASEQ